MHIKSQTAKCNSSMLLLFFVNNYLSLNFSAEPDTQRVPSFVYRSVCLSGLPRKHPQLDSEENQADIEEEAFLRPKESAPERVVY